MKGNTSTEPSLKQLTCDLSLWQILGGSKATTGSLNRSLQVPRVPLFADWFSLICESVNQWADTIIESDGVTARVSKRGDCR